MEEPEAYIDPESINIILNSLSPVDDEQKLRHEIDYFSSQLDQVEPLSFLSDQAGKIRSHIKVLEVKLNYLIDMSSDSKPATRH